MLERHRVVREATLREGDYLARPHREYQQAFSSDDRKDWLVRSVSKCSSSKNAGNAGNAEFCFGPRNSMQDRENARRRNKLD